VGKEFVKQFARFTKADVAASENATGSSRQGGDWRLEVSAGDIETNLPFDARQMRQFSGKLGTVVAWGGNAFGESNVPAGLTNVVQVGGGENFSLALKSDGTVVAWGVNGSG
jgi:hypothetical protein